jgi:hypothetical protein
VHPIVLAVLVACGGAPPTDNPKAAPAAAKASAEPAPVLEMPARKSDTERGSKNGRTEATFGDVDVVVTYGRPSQKGRTLFGELVPYDAVWRTGADEATVLKVTGPVQFAGKPLDAGVYGLFTIPGEKEWTVVVNRVADQWGSYSYDESQDVLRAPVPVREGEQTEAFTIEAVPTGLSLRWGTTAVDIPVEKRP